MESDQNKRFIRKGVGIIVEKNHSILLGKRRGSRSAGFFGLPGGFLESHESFDDCANRELLEETGLKLGKPISIMRISGFVDGFRYIDVIYYLNSPSSTPIIKEPNRAESWDYYYINQLPNPIFPPSQKTLRLFKYYYKFFKFVANFKRNHQQY